MSEWSIIEGDVMARIADIESASVQTCITSPPYWGLRDYGHAEQLGLEPTPEEYTEKIVAVFREVRRVLRDDGTLWLNLGDSYCSVGGSGVQGKHGECADRAAAIRGVRESRGMRRTASGLKHKDLVGIPWRVAFALQADGWYLRSDIIWAKPNPMPESVTDRPTKSHEYLFLLAKAGRYYYDAGAISEVSEYSGEQAGICRGTKRRATAIGKEPSGNEKIGANWIQPPTRNRRTVWTIPTQPFPGAHFAVFPTTLAEPCILAGSRMNDLVLDPFAGSGTVGVVCRKHCRRFVGIEINPEYAAMARGRLGGYAPTEEPKNGTADLWSVEVGDPTQKRGDDGRTKN